MRPPTPDHINQTDAQKETHPERRPTKFLIHIAAILTIATLAQAIAHLWAILTWPAIFTVALALSAYSLIRPSPTALKIRHAIRSIPGSPSRALHRALEHASQRLQAKRDRHEG